MSPAALIGSVVVLVVLAAGGIVYARQSDRPHCRGQARLRVAAAAEIAPAVRATAARWVRGGASVGGLCAAVEVTTVEPADVAGAIAAQHGVILDSLGPPSGAVAVPDVWIPDSTTWLVRIAASVPGFPTTASSVAASPVVLAMPEPVARRFGWPRNPLAWRTVINQLNDTDPLTMGVVEPSRDAASLAGLLSLVQAGGDADTGGPSTARAMRSLSHGRSATRPDLLRELANGANNPDPEVAAAPLPEQAVVAYNAGRPAVPLAALYPDPAARVLDFPYVPLPGIDAIRSRAAAGLRQLLGQADFAGQLAGAGLREPTGGWGPRAAVPTAAPAAVAVSPTATAPAIAQRAPIDRALATWTAVTVPTRMLMVFDMSGSMLQRVPHAGNATRAQVTAAAAQRGLALFDEESSLGAWVFSTRMDGDRDYRSILPIAPLDTRHRARTTAAIGALAPKVGGATGLYDSTRAAYLQMRDGWEAGKANTVVVFTDGRNEDPGGPSLATLLADLRRASDPRRPVQLIMIGIGGDADPGPLRKIGRATGGESFVTDDPAGIGDIFLRAMAQRGNLVAPG